MDAGIAVAVGDIDLVFRREGDVGAAIEGLAALVGRRLSGYSQGHQDLSIERALAHRVIPVVGQVDSVVRTHRDAVGALEEPFAPGTEKVSVAIKDDDRVLAPAEGGEPGLPFHSHARDFAVRPAVGQPAPAFGDFVDKIPASHGGCHNAILSNSLLKKAYLPSAGLVVSLRSDAIHLCCA